MYEETLKQHLFTFCDILAGVEWRFQHDNASIYKSHITKEWLSDREALAFQIG